MFLISVNFDLIISGDQQKLGKKINYYQSDHGQDQPRSIDHISKTANP